VGFFSYHISLLWHITAAGLLYAPINKSSQEEVSVACGTLTYGLLLV